MREEDYVDILKQHLKTSVRKLKLGCKWVFQMDNDPKHISKVVAKWLKDNKVKVLDDSLLPSPPQYLFYLSTGLCGKPLITDVGGVPYLVKVDTEYNMNNVSKEMELPGAFIFGAGAVSSRNVGMNAEVLNSSWFSSINPADGQCLLEKYSDTFSDCDFGLLANLYVIEVRDKRRTGGCLVDALRTSMEEHCPNKSLALGGTFIIQKGKAKIHIMPREFSACPLNSNDDVNKWPKHFEVSAPLICQTVSIDLIYYTTPDTVEYLGYFMPAELVCRIDRAKDTHDVGRD
uniref:Chromosome 11 open reading frame 54 n=1 Tax=Hucho hucho TaxID=62062 RepID=A0A4W5PRF0_9TELE